MNCGVRSGQRWCHKLPFTLRHSNFTASSAVIEAAATAVFEIHGGGRRWSCLSFRGGGRTIEDRVKEIRGDELGVCLDLRF